MITLRLVHGIPRGFHPSFGGAAAGVGTLTGSLTLGTGQAGTAAGVGAATGALFAETELAGLAAGVGAVAGAVAVEGGLVGFAAGVGGLTGDLALYLPGLDFSDFRNSGYLVLLEDI